MAIFKNVIKTVFPLSLANNGWLSSQNLGRQPASLMLVMPRSNSPNPEIA